LVVRHSTFSRHHRIFAELPDGTQKVAWEATSTLGSLDAIASVSRGNGQIMYLSKELDRNGDGIRQIKVNSVPIAATDSLRNGPINITVTVVN
jgi:hypothetical protein